MSSLMHHGVKGQHWGIRRYQNKDGTRTAAGKKREQYLENARVLKRGTGVGRVHLDPSDKTYDKKKYVSTLPEDHAEWRNYFGAEYARRWKPIYETTYAVTKDTYVATGKDVSKVISERLNSKTYQKDIASLKEEAKIRGYDWHGTSVEDHNSLLLATQKKSGKRIIKELKKMGFGAIEDDHGKNVAKDPVIILDPDKNLVKVYPTSRNDKYVQRYSEEYTKRVLGILRQAQHTSIGGTMYIEGNALILGDSSYLEHHGILGQKWGVRRFQNKDGTRTAAGKKREAENATSGKAMIKKYKNYKGKTPEERLQILQAVLQDATSSSTSSPKEEKELYEAADVGLRALQKLRPGVLTDEDYSPENIDRNKEWFLIEDQTTGMGMISHLIDQKGYSAKDCKDLIKIVNKNYGPDEWNEWTDQRAEELIFELQEGNYKGTLEKFADLCEKESIKKKRDQQWLDELAEIEREEQREIDELGYDPYGVYAPSYQNAKHSALFIEDGTLYLSHHGVKGQRWGVRRFQNRDGSLTNAGRKRLGYATKGAAQTVKKAFKAGVKTGGKAIKAVKAHHEKKEAEKLQKKKEKASKTRLGVMANKDLFTNEEIRKLNERFKLEDEMKMATLQKGVEIAKAVGTIAQNVGTMAKAYEDVTGQSLSPIKRKAAEEKAKQDAEDRKRKLAKEDAETKRAEDKEKRDIEDRERRIKLEDEDRVRKQAKEDADAQRAENAEKRAQAKEQRDSSMAVELQRKAKAAADEQEHKAVKAKAESRSSILDVLEKIDKIQDHDDDDHNNPPGGGIDTWDDDDYLNFFKKTGIIHSDISDPSIIQNGVLFIDSSDGFAHHGVRGQRWGVRKFQNADGSLTEKGRKHYEKAIAKEKRKQVSSDAIRGTLERQHPFAVTGAAIMGAVAAGMSIVATGGASVAMIAAGSAISAAVSAGLTHVGYSASEAWEGRGTRMRSKKIDKYENILKQSDGENGMYHVENGTLFINAGEPYLEHHGVKGMKWGKHLMAGKGEAGAGGGAGEDDEKLKEMAKKAGMSVAEYRQKFASKLGSAAGKVGEKSAKEKKRLLTQTSAEAKRISLKDKMKADRARKKSARQDKVFSGTSPKEKKRVARKDQYLALPEQKKRSRSYDNKAAETRRARAERLTRDSEIFNRAAEESKRKQNSALNKGNKREAEQHGKNANFAQDWAEEGRRGAKDWRTGRRTGKTVLRTDSLDQVKKQHDKTLSGKLDKARHTIQRGKQKLYNAAGGKYKEAYQKKKVQYRNDYARMERAKAKGDHWNASAAGSMFNIHSQEANQLYNKYDDSLAGRYDEFKEKRKKKKAKHFDDTNAIYTEGTRLVINSKWG